MTYILAAKRPNGQVLYVRGLTDPHTPYRSAAMRFATEAEARDFNAHRVRNVDWAVDHEPEWVPEDRDIGRFARRRELPADAAREIAALSAAERRLTAEAARHRERHDELTKLLSESHARERSARRYIEAAERAADHAIAERDKMKAELAKAVSGFKALAEAWSDAP